MTYLGRWPLYCRSPQVVHARPGGVHPAVMPSRSSSAVDAEETPLSKHTLENMYATIDEAEA